MKRLLILLAFTALPAFAFAGKTYKTHGKVNYTYDREDKKNIETERNDDYEMDFAIEGDYIRLSNNSSMVALKIVTVADRKDGSVSYVTKYENQLMEVLVDQKYKRIAVKYSLTTSDSEVYAIVGVERY